jgi:mannose-6-phosphate isomerase-like protein (cupin superfamily)
MPHKQVRTIASWRVDPPNERSLKVIFTPQLDEAFPNATFLISTLVPHTGQTGKHTHPVDEIIYIVSGYGLGEEAGVPFRIEPGTVIYAKAGVEHDCRNLGDETMQLYCVYIPALPDETVKRIVSQATVRLKE